MLGGWKRREGREQGGKAEEREEEGQSGYWCLETEMGQDPELGNQVGRELGKNTALGSSPALQC